MDTTNTRDVIVIGASAGGIQALSSLVADLPADLPASVLIVQHLAEESPGLVPSLLARRARIEVVTAENGMPLVHGRIYVAPPGRHTLVVDDSVCVALGARENRSRPAIDPLFRTAAAYHGARVIGVVLTGMLADGASGLYAVARCGGVAIVQAPEDAQFPEMPKRALERVPSATVASLAELPALLDRRCREPAGPSPPVPEDLRIEVGLTERATSADDWNRVPGSPSRYTCPSCAGALQSIDDGGVLRYRCRVGHAYSGPDLVAAKTAALEESIWIALQTLEERAEMLRNMARSDESRGWRQTAARLQQRADESERHAETLRATLLDLSA